MLLKLSRVLSIVCHPLLMPLFGLFFLSKSGLLLSYNIPEFRASVYFTMVFGTILLPLMLIPFFIYFKLIKSVVMEERHERIFPLMLTFILYGFTYYWLKHNYPFDRILLDYMLCISVVLLVLLLVSIFWKISMHMAGIGGLCGLVLIASLRLDINLVYSLCGVFFIAGILGSARLMAGSHKPAQIYVGFFLGMAIFMIMMHF